MEKISHIVGSSPRVGATDLKNAQPVRPGVPSFGRPIGESPHFTHDDLALSTAQRAGLMERDMTEQRKTRNETKIVSDMASGFFNRPEMHAPASRAGGPEAAHGRGGSSAPVHMPVEAPVSVRTGVQESLIDDDEPVRAAPSRYSPRGSYLDVRA